MKKSFVIISCLLCLTVFGSVRARQSGMSAELRALVEAERAFSRTSGERGMKDAFLAFAAAAGVVFRRAAVNARETWLATEPAPTSLLSWQPTYADISRAGDLGYTTGPYEFRAHATDKDAQGTGHYVTLWRKQPDASWKFELDMGIRHKAGATSSAPVLRYSFAERNVKTGNAHDVDTNAARAALLDTERELALAYSSKGTTKAFLSYAAPDVRLYRQNSFPFVGREAARVALEAQSGVVVTWLAAKAGVARSGDLGYAYGTYELRGKVADAKPTEEGNYLRIWKKQAGGKWKVVLDETNPVPPQSKN